MALSAALRLPLPRLTRRTAFHAVIAGVAWGAVFTAGFTIYAWGCDAVCLDDVLVTAATSVAAGIVAIGPLAAFR